MRNPKAVCATRGCKRRPQALEFCRTHARKQCDKLFEAIVRARGVCFLCGATHSQLQCAHLVSRSYLPTRWNLRNAWCLCSSCHLHYTYRPLEWWHVVNDTLGALRFTKLRAVAMSSDIARGTKPDYATILTRLRKVAVS